MPTDSNGKRATGGQGVERQAARSTDSPRSDSPARPAAVVGIGASAGGVEALDLSRCREGSVVSDESSVFRSRDGHEIDVKLELTLLTRENGEADAIAVLAKPVDQ